MKPLIADFHIHSPFSRATSPKGFLPMLFAWAKIKGIHIVGTGDFTHPGWQAHLREHLIPAEAGLFKLKDESVAPALAGVEAGNAPVRFILTTEISSIYKKHGAVRKIHNVLFAPDFESVARITTTLAGIGNLEADGRPILGLDARDLLEIVLEKAPHGFLVPAHIWTPWFSLFGSKSGFDRIEDCFEDLTAHVFALETGLSSDPEMNRLISALDRYTLMSNSDSHSPSKLGREANLFSTELDFFALRAALENPAQGFLGTVEFFPEEGKYHLDGHRHCKVCWEPEQTRHHQGRCSVCGKPVTVGVLHRVMELADRSQARYPDDAPAVHSLIPLPELVGEIVGTRPESKKVQAVYAETLRRFGSEFEVLLHAPIAQIRAEHSDLLAEAVRRMRAGEVIRHGGFDGEYGVIRVFTEAEKAVFCRQNDLFGKYQKPRVAHQTRQIIVADRPPPAKPVEQPSTPLPLAHNLEQAAILKYTDGHVLVTAGPGTGKTFTLIARLIALLQSPQVTSAQIAVITFTNRAADEVRSRLSMALGCEPALFIGTFHGFALHWLRQTQTDLRVVGEEARLWLVKKHCPALRSREREQVSKAVSAYYHAPENDLSPTDSDTAIQSCVSKYLTILAEENAIDLDNLLPAFVARLAQDPALLQHLRAAVNWLLVDEFQDLDASQYALVQQLADSAHIFAIGDPNQAIYGFRGANPRYFARFAEECHASRRDLVRNYRSQATILHAAHALIQHNDPATPAPEAQHPGGETVQFYRAPSPQAEAGWIASCIENLTGGTCHRTLANATTNYAFGDFALLYRFTQQADTLYASLAERGIPAQVVGTVPFFLHPPLRPIYYFLRTAADPAAPEFLPLAASVPGIGKTSLQRLEQALPWHFDDFFAALERADIPRQLTAKLLPLAQAHQQFRLHATQHGIAQALPAILSFFKQPTDSPEAIRLCHLAALFGHDWHAFAAHLGQAATVYDPRAAAVTLMTLHAAKGLEFPVVFMSGMEQGVFPSRLAISIAEERRLCYVGMTRAQQRLFLTCSATRQLFGDAPQRSVSQFVGEIPSQYLTEVSVSKKRQRLPQLKPQLPLF